MVEFTVSEKRCHQLRQDMLNEMIAIKKIVDEFEESKDRLKQALGENDYRGVMNKVAAIKTELELAEGHLKEVADCMGEYIERVKQIRVVLNG